jgi:enoyl-CoA hydratase
MGVGFEFALSADIRVGERADHRYGLIETRLGIVPGGTGLTRMARMIGPGKAMLLGAGARALTPEEAFEAGLVELLEDDALATATAIAERMATLPRVAVAMAKRIVYQSVGVPLSVALEFEVDSAYRAKRSPEAASALRDYLAQPLEERRGWFER